MIVKIDEKLGLEKEKYRTAVILRSDGTSLYLTKDLALAKVKFEEYQRRPLHLCGRYPPESALPAGIQDFRIVGFPASREMLSSCLWLCQPAGGCHVGPARACGAVQRCGRRGRAPRAGCHDRAHARDVPETRAWRLRARSGWGHWLTAMLSVDNNKDIVFDVNEALSFDGRTAPYIQNAHVRANSILRKAGGMPGSANFHHELDFSRGAVDRPDLALPGHSRTGCPGVSSAGDRQVRLRPGEHVPLVLSQRAGHPGGERRRCRLLVCGWWPRPSRCWRMLCVCWSFRRRR